MDEKPKDPKDKVRELQRSLWMSAKRSKSRRFHALYDRIHRSDILWEAWRRVRANRGAAGVDQETLEAIEQKGAEDFVKAIQANLIRGKYRPRSVRRCYIPKTDGKQRPLGIPTVRDRVVQMATKIVVEPIFEADFRSVSYGFRPKRNATQALEAVREAGNRGHNFVVDADIRSYFEKIDRTKLMRLVSERVSDRRVLKLIRQWLKAGVMEDGTVRETLAGTPQGGVISPLLSNIYLNAFDRVWEEERNRSLGVLVRYADDFVVMCQRQSQAQEAHRRIEGMLKELGLELNTEKTRMVDLRHGKEGFVFLGCMVHKRRSVQRNPRRHFMQRWPSSKSMKKIRERVRGLTRVRGNRTMDIVEMIKSLNPILRGWGNYFRTGNADREFNRIDRFVQMRLVRWQWRRGGQRRRFNGECPSECLYGMGLHRLQGRTTYPAQAASIRPSVSRVRENCTHGLKGGLWKPGLN